MNSFQNLYIFIYSYITNHKWRLQMPEESKLAEKLEEKQSEVIEKSGMSSAVKDKKEYNKITKEIITKINLGKRFLIKAK